MCYYINCSVIIHTNLLLFFPGGSSNTNSVVSSAPPRKVAATAEQGHKVGEVKFSWFTFTSHVGGCTFLSNMHFILKITVALKVKLLSEPTVERGIANGPLGRGLWMFTKHRLIWYGADDE